MSLKGVRKQKFTPLDDKRLMDLVLQYGQKWEVIAKKMNNKNSRQVKDRYINYLAPNIKSGAWSSQEEAKLMSLFLEIGPHWKKIASFLDGRTEVDTKNHFKMMLRHQRREQIRRFHQTSKHKKIKESPPPVFVESPHVTTSTVDLFDESIFGRNQDFSEFDLDNSWFGSSFL